MKRPATTAYIAAAEYADLLRFLLGRPSDDPTTATAHMVDGLAAAEALRDAARAVWMASDEERDWSIGGESWGGCAYDGGDGDDILRRVCPSDVAAELEEGCRDGAWDRVHVHDTEISDWACPIDPVTEEPTEDGRVDVTTTIEAVEEDYQKFLADRQPKFSDDDDQTKEPIEDGRIEANLADTQPKFSDDDQ